MTCIYFHPEAYTTSGPKLMGRNAAGESFLRGFFSHSQSNEFWTQVQDRRHAQIFTETARFFNRTEPVHVITKNTLQDLKKPGVVFYPEPNISRYAWQRAAFGHGAWSLCGITHTTSSAGAMDAIADLITAPVQPWDALICTSNAVKSNVIRVLQSQVDYLKDRLGITQVTLPQLPVIPLGIHTCDFVYNSSQKKAARETLRAPDDAVVVLFMGRLSFHAKAHPLAMYQALAKATKESNKKIILVECGWHANKFIAKAHIDAAQLVCPSVQIITLDGRKANDRKLAWASADIFCSLSDSIQETFGITPIEAMAAGLPLVVSDWDGYKDTVRDGVDGFRIPTQMPQAGLGRDLALRHALDIDSYDEYCGLTCSLIGVDVLAATDAFIKLVKSPILRQSMGEAGQKRVKAMYDWRILIPQYEALWAEQSRIRIAASVKKGKLAHPWPARMDPFFAFSEYPSQVLTAVTKFSLVDEDRNGAFTRIMAYRQLAMVGYAKIILPSDAEIQSVLSKASSTPTSALELTADIKPLRRPLVLRSFAWMIKLGIFSCHP